MADDKLFGLPVVTDERMPRRKVAMVYGVQDNATGLTYRVWEPQIVYVGAMGAVSVPVAANLPKPSDAV